MTLQEIVNELEKHKDVANGGCPFCHNKEFDVIGDTCIIAVRKCTVLDIPQERAYKGYILVCAVCGYIAQFMVCNKGGKVEDAKTEKL